MYYYLLLLTAISIITVIQAVVVGTQKKQTQTHKDNISINKRERTYPAIRVGVSHNVLALVAAAAVHTTTPHRRSSGLIAR